MSQPNPQPNAQPAAQPGGQMNPQPTPQSSRVPENNPNNQLSGTPASGQPTDDYSNMKASKFRVWFHQAIGRHIDAVSMSTKLVTCIIVLLTVGTISISYFIRISVGSYLLDKTDTQLLQQSELVLNNITWLSNSNKEQPQISSYYLQVRDNNDVIQNTPLQPVLQDGVESRPVLPANGSRGGVTLGTPFTTAAIVQVPAGVNASHAALQSASAPWRVVALNYQVKVDGVSVDQGIVYIGLSLSGQVDTVNSLTKFCAMIGIAVVLLGAVLGTIMVQSTLAPLKRIEKTAAKIAAGDLGQRVPSLPENTELGSLSASLNGMLARIEGSFHAQEETTEKMKRFVSDASHELRTPLAAIHGYAELYKMQRDMPGALERADASIAHIEASSSRMTVLVEDLLSLARLDEGRGIDMTQQVQITSIVNDAADDLHALDPERDITCGRVVLRSGGSTTPGVEGTGSCLAFEAGDMPPITLTGDASRLRQVVTNIVGNIHRYTPTDSPVEVGVGLLPASISPESLSRMPSDEGAMRHLVEAIEVGKSMQVGMNYAVVRISDHGPGVPAEARSKIFERFYTADPSRARQKGGTGLGMAIAQSVVKAHRGFICASGSDGGGLTLTVVLPVAPVEPKPLPVQTDKTDRRAEKRARKTKLV